MSESGQSRRHWRLDWPTSGGGRLAQAQLKSCPEDFRVDEQLDGFPDRSEAQAVTGAGEHLCLRLEKTGDNTDYVARELATLSGCRSFDVGFCGLKDRHAVTRQWFSIYRPGLEQDDPAFIRAVSERWSVHAVCRHPRKLRRGEHQRNHFLITLREVRGDRPELEAALVRLQQQGAPNYFGPQRFGHHGANLDRAVAMDPSAMDSRHRQRGRGRKGKHRAGRDASKNVLYFSAARSWLFNEVLASRVEDGSWLTPMAGDPGLTLDEPVPTGPLWGDGGTGAEPPLGDVEREVVDQWPEVLALFATTRMKPERRPLVVQPRALTWDWHGDGSLQLGFSLAPGQYATTVLSDIFELEDLSLGRDNKERS